MLPHEHQTFSTTVISTSFHHVTIYSASQHLFYFIFYYLGIFSFSSPSPPFFCVPVICYYYCYCCYYYFGFFELGRAAARHQWGHRTPAPEGPRPRGRGGTQGIIWSKINKKLQAKTSSNIAADKIKTQTVYERKYDANTKVTKVQLQTFVFIFFTFNYLFSFSFLMHFSPYKY
uniref:Uncharacterized protein n=1 Tax=Trypanosoma congolense (strain IL3000) TaxID=1068625 RepID=G0UN47_TRYCI|nr:hypothetical protein TCIL3000_6_330 [Trypanosoma congolense IL3000]